MKETGIDSGLTIETAGHRIIVSVSSSGVTGIRLPHALLNEGYADKTECNGSGMLELNKRAALSVSENRFMVVLEEYIHDVFQGKQPFLMPLISISKKGFEKQVLLAAAQIPWGETRTYSWVAEKVGRPGAARAVGNALGKNPLPILIPCHRVVRSDGGLGGYSSGLCWKKKLISMEKCNL